MLKVTSNALRQQVVNREGYFLFNYCGIWFLYHAKLFIPEL